ncbi:hypothetical protein ACSQ67_007589 [Phaseolus vulgaris]
MKRDHIAVEVGQKDELKCWCMNQSALSQSSPHSHMTYVRRRLEISKFTATFNLTSATVGKGRQAPDRSR